MRTKGSIFTLYILLYLCLSVSTVSAQSPPLTEDEHREVLLRLLELRTCRATESLCVEQLRDERGLHEHERQIWTRALELEKRATELERRETELERREKEATERLLEQTQELLAEATRRGFCWRRLFTLGIAKCR